MTRTPTISLLLAALLLLAAPGATAQPDAPERGWVGIEVRSFEPGERDRLGFDKEHGMVVTAVVPGSPAAHAGLQAGDVLTRLGRQPARDLDHLEQALEGTRPGVRLTFAAWRDGRMFEGAIALGTPGTTTTPAPGGEQGRRVDPATVHERQRLAARLEVVEATLRRTREQLLAASDAGRERQVRQLLEAFEELSRAAGHLEAQIARLDNEARPRLRPGDDGRSALWPGWGLDRRTIDHRIETLRIAMDALRGSRMRGQPLETLERRIHVLELVRAGPGDAETRRQIAAGPPDDEVAELLYIAAELLRRRGAPDRAERCQQLADALRARHLGEPHTVLEPHEEPHDGETGRHEDLERRMEQLQHLLEQMRRELDRLRR